MIGLRRDDGTGSRTAVLDVLSPLTRRRSRRRGAPSIIEHPDLTLLGARPPGAARSTCRARGSSEHAGRSTLHPCSDGTCAVGTDRDPRAFDAIVGMDAFASDALRLARSAAATSCSSCPTSRATRPTRSRRAMRCCPRPFRGGGTLIIGGTELDVHELARSRSTPASRRIPTETTPQSAARRRRAARARRPAIGISMLDETAYTRYAQANALKAKSLAAVEQGPMVTVDIASGPVSDGTRGSLRARPPRRASRCPCSRSPPTRRPIRAGRAARSTPTTC